jgi:hypothetical protein
LGLAVQLIAEESNLAEAVAVGLGIAEILRVAVAVHWAALESAAIRHPG